ncbi:MAG: replication-relaxation family protein [Candidatus Saccharibacteria bacterium]
MKPIPTAQSKPKHRKQLNVLQTELLQTLYKFRFGTAELLSQYQEQSVRYTNVRLKILLKQEYVGRNYDSSYRIKQRPATYFLLPKAVRLLKTNPELDPKGLHLQYYNRAASALFVGHWLRLFRIYLKLNRLYGEQLECFMGSELAEQSRFPRPLPDAYLSFSGAHAGTPDCMLELLESSTPLDRLRQRLNRYLRHYELGSWEGEYPRILLVCDNVGLQREIQRYMARTLEYRGVRVQCYITTVKALMNAGGYKDDVWTDVGEPDGSLAL